MRGYFLAGAAALLVLAAVVLLAHPGVDEEVPPPPAPADASVRDRRTPPASAPLGAAAASRDAPEVAAAAPSVPAPAGGLAARDARLVRAAGLAPAGDSATARLLRSYSAEELALLARFEALTGTARSPALEELIALRRAGAGAPTLVEAATRLFAGDPLGRAAALEWIRAAATE